MAASDKIILGTEGNTVTVETSLPTPQSFDGEDARDTYHETVKGYTRNDRVDMSRMGKIQELRVFHNTSRPRAE